jgi:RimJ/RimL family protein N-acetyltransferase
MACGVGQAGFVPHVWNIRKVPLDVFANDRRAVCAYRAAGFVEEGRRRARARYVGAYRDTLMTAASGRNHLPTRRRSDTTLR